MGRYRCLGKRTVDPREVEVRIRKQAAVDFYCEQPNGVYDRGFFADNGPVLVFIRDDGSMVANGGNHRIAAAARMGRRIRAEVWTTRGGPQDRRSWWS